MDLIEEIENNLAQAITRAHDEAQQMEAEASFDLQNERPYKEVE